MADIAAGLEDIGNTVPENREVFQVRVGLVFEESSLLRNLAAR